MTTPASTKPASSTPAPLVRQDIEIATRAADHFTRLFYAAYDSDTRLADLPKFYRESSSLLWNGKPSQGLDGLTELIKNMPVTKHDIQSFDCQPVPGTSPPSLLVNVSGSVTYGRGPSGNPPNTPAKTVEGHPRAFSQTFILVPDSSAVVKPGEVAKYYVGTDSLRFVG